MPTKTERILSYLPPTFRALPRPTALFAVVDAAGEQLLQAENSLGAVMLSHWVDHADKRAEFITDLACFAALYGLAPRGATKDVARFQMPTCVPVSADETVEQFREHLKRYVRTFLEGTVSVQGILRIVAEALGLHIDDNYADMDTWWTRSNDPFISSERCGDDAADLLFGKSVQVTARRIEASSAELTGERVLPAEFNLSYPSELSIGVDGAKPVVVDLRLGKNATLREVIKRINQRIASPIATGAAGALSITSPTRGARSRLVFAESANDVSEFLLGLGPQTFFGTAPNAAEVTGTVPLEGQLDLRRHRYLRLLIDDELAEVDCGGDNPANRTISDVVAAINDAFKEPVASTEGHFLKLQSGIIGTVSRIEFQSPAAQDAKEFLFGPIDPICLGQDANAASVSAGIWIPGETYDLSKHRTLRLAVDDAPPIGINCAGKVPSATDVHEIIDAVNKAVGAVIATLENSGKEELVFRSTTTGPTSRLRFAMGEEPDAATIIFGIRPRAFTGADAAPARLIGTVDLSHGADLRSRHMLEVAVDGGNPLQIDLWSASRNLKAVSLAELCIALNSALGKEIASSNGTHLILASPTIGAAGSIAILQAQETIVRRFVTRAFITDDAATKILGFTRFKATGTDPTHAQLVGTVDLSRGTDLRTSRFLRIAIDSEDPRDVDCAARARIPRAATLAEVIEAINSHFSAPIASGDGRHLILTSPTNGLTSTVSLKPTLAMDATGRLLVVAPTFASGRSATVVRFTGTTDLSQGVDLRYRDRIKIGVDGAEPVEIVCAGPHGRLTTLDQIVDKINQVFPGVSLHDGTQIHLASHSAGSKSQLEFAVPAARDATAIIFGIAPPRVYKGDAPANAVIKGNADLRHGVDLTTERFLCLSVNGRPLFDIDCSAASREIAKAQLPEIVKAINDAAGASIATSDNVNLILSSPGKGIHERIDLSPCNNGDARATLFGQGPYRAAGEAAQPATIHGKVNLRHPVDLAEGSILRLAVDGEPPIDIDVAGVEPDHTSADEIVHKIAASVDVTADLDGDLILHSPTRGQRSTLELLPVRALELIDYPPISVIEPPVTLQEGNRFSVNNDGAADSQLEFDLNAPQGDSGMEFVDRARGTRIRILAEVVAGGKLAIKPIGRIGVSAEVTAPDGKVTQLPDSRIQSGKIGAQARVPFTGEWPLSRPGGPDQRPALQLNDPSALAIVILRALSELNAGENISVQVTEARSAIGGSRIVALGPTYLWAIGRLRRADAGDRLVDESEATILHLQAGVTARMAFPPDRLVAVRGSIQEARGWPRTLVPDQIMPLFDVRVRFTTRAHSAVEAYSAVTIGLGDTPLSLQVKILERPSQFVRAEEFAKAEPLRFPRGSLDLTYMDCHEARFDRVVFASKSASQKTSGGEVARFAGGRCHEWAVFDISRFSDNRLDGEAALFGLSVSPDPAVQVESLWIRHQPGAFVVNLPADLDKEFGARFNHGRFGPAAGKPEQYQGVITEPASDPDYIVKRINARSTLVTAAPFPGSVPPPGFEAFKMPFLNPRSRTLSGGSKTQFASMYLAEDGVPGLIQLQARIKGDWGNSIAVTARQAGTVRFDMTIGFEGLRFENAREVALAGRILQPGEDPLSQVAAQILKPSPVGVLQAKAAGIRAEVTRDRTAVSMTGSCRPSTKGETQRREHNGKRS
jgi:hypothetical protein